MRPCGFGPHGRTSSCVASSITVNETSFHAPMSTVSRTVIFAVPLTLGEADREAIGEGLCEIVACSYPSPNPSHGEGDTIIRPKGVPHSNDLLAFDGGAHEMAALVFVIMHAAMLQIAVVPHHHGARFPVHAALELNAIGELREILHQRF